MVGDDVIFKRKDVIQWEYGTVEELWYRGAKWPDNRPSCPYRVLSMQGKDVVPIEHDTEAYIRVAKHAQNPTLPLLYGDVALPEPKDPLEYIYQPIPESPEDESLQCFIALSEMKTGTMGNAEVIKKLSNGGGMVRFQGGAASSTAADDPCIPNRERSTIFVPNLEGNPQEYKGEPIPLITNYIAERISFRRPVRQCRKYNARQLYHSIFPEEQSISALEKTIRRLETEAFSSYHDDGQRCQKLLNMGDALILLWRPLQCTRDFERANKCYIAAGFDISECHNPEDVRGPARGSPEAMCANATMLHYSTERLLYRKMHNIACAEAPSAGMDRPMQDVDQIINGAFKLPQIKDNISVTVSFLSSALRHGWFSLLAFLYGKAFNSTNIAGKIEMIWRDGQDRNNIKCLQTAHRHWQITLQIQEEKMAKTYLTRHGVPSAETISTFAPRAIDVLRSMPTHFPSTHSQNKLQTLNLHISFFELPIPSSPVCVLLFCPAESTMEFLRIPDEFQLFPFSQESFQWVWNRIAYLIHLGIRKPTNGYVLQNPHETRVRPKAFKIKSVGGDLQFANFLQIKCFLLPGTKVELLEVDGDFEDEMGFHYEDRELWCADVQSGINQLQKEEVKKQYAFLSKLKPSSKSILTSMRSSSSESENKVVKRVISIKSAGNAAYGGHRFQQAQKYYEEGISELRRINDPQSKEVFELVGTQLSNYAICGLDMAKSQLPSYGVSTLKEVVAVCDIALLNPKITKALSGAVLAKLRFRRDLALARQPAIDPTLLHRIDEFRGDSVGVVAEVNYNLRLFRKESEKQNKTSKDKITIFLGKDIEETETETLCPICRDDFRTVLANKHVVRLQCGHLHCGKCFLGWNRAGKLDCGLCRLKADEDIWNEALGALVKASSMDERVARLPLDSQAERLEVFRSLFIENDLDVGATSRALDNFLYMNNWRLWGVKDLSWQQKEEIYNDARRPVLKLEAELKETQEKCDAAAGKDKQESQRLDRKLKDIEQKLRFAKQNAEEDVFARINASGSMGTLNCRGNIQLDFHGLHVKEAKQKFEEIVLPVLPVVGSLVLILGRGLHSSSKRGILKPALQKYVTQKYCHIIEWEGLKGNMGAVQLSFRAEHS